MPPKAGVSLPPSLLPWGLRRSVLPGLSLYLQFRPSWHASHCQKIDDVLIHRTAQALVAEQDYQNKRNGSSYPMYIVLAPD